MKNWLIICLAFLLGLFIFSTSIVGVGYFFDYFHFPNWLRYTLGIPVFALSVFGGYSMWRETLRQFEVDQFVDEE